MFTRWLGFRAQRDIEITMLQWTINVFRQNKENTWENLIAEQGLSWNRAGGSDLICLLEN